MSFDRDDRFRRQESPPSLDLGRMRDQLAEMGEQQLIMVSKRVLSAQDVLDQTYRGMFTGHHTRAKIDQARANLRYVYAGAYEFLSYQVRARRGY